MSTNVRRTSLFNRRFALTRKAAVSVTHGGESIKQDPEGFDDLDEYFESTKARIIPKLSEPVFEEREKIVEYEEAPLPDYEMNDIENHQPLDNEDEDEDEDEDEEVSIKETIKITKSPQSTPTEITKNKKKEKKNSVNSRSKPKSTTRQTKLEPLVSINRTEEEEDGFVRRSKRNRYEPLAFWRNEKVIYGRRQSTKMPVIVDILKTDSEKSPTKQQILRRRRLRNPSNNQNQKNNKDEIESQSRTQSKLKELGYSGKIKVETTVMDYDSHCENDRLIALGSDQIQTTTVKGENFGIQTIFTEGSFLSSGILEFPAFSIKPTRNSSKHALIFYVIEGAVEVDIHKTTFIAGNGSQFIVPRGNQYSIRSVWDGDTRLFFCHCKDTSQDS